MKKSVLFTKRNIIEMLRNPLLYIFCIGFPIIMVILFQIIQSFSGDSTPIFEPKGLIPGIMMFSYCFLMLMASLHISKDKTTSILKRLFTSPMKAHHFIIGYFIPFFILGICQSIICIILGYISSGITGVDFCSFSKSLILIFEMIPIMIINIMLGFLFGIILNDKSAPAICSIFISASGVLGGAWMPIDIMGGFEKACVYLPFYPSVYLGRIITGAIHTPINPSQIASPVAYTFNTQASLSLVILFLYLALAAILPVILFKKRMKSDRL